MVSGVSLSKKCVVRAFSAFLTLSDFGALSAAAAAPVSFFRLGFGGFCAAAWDVMAISEASAMALSERLSMCRSLGERALVQLDIDDFRSSRPHECQQRIRPFFLL